MAEERESVIKCALVKHLLDQALLPTLRACVEFTSKAVHRGSLFACYFLLHCLEREVPDAQLPDLKGTRFWEHCFKVGFPGVRPRKPVAGLAEFYTSIEDHFPPVPAAPTATIAHSMMWRALSYSALQYRTNVTNHLVCNFDKRVRSYIMCLADAFGLPVNRATCSSVVRALRFPSPELAPLEPFWAQFVQEERARLGIPGDAAMTDAFLKSDLRKLLRYHHAILSQLEASEAKTFSLLPLGAIKLHFLTVDLPLLYTILHAEGRCSKQEFDQEPAAWFRRVFAIQRLAPGPDGGHPGRPSFSNVVETDGTSLSVHLRRPAAGSQACPSVPAVQPGDTVIGLDPGVINLAYAIRRNGDGSEQHFKLSGREYRNRAHITRNGKRTQRWNAAIQATLDQLSQLSPKTALTAGFRTYLTGLLPLLPLLWGHYGQAKWGRLRFDNYVAKRQTLDKFFQSLKPPGGGSAVVAFGDARFPATGRGRVSAPTSKVLEACKRHFTVLMVDEYHTTKCCARCGSELKHFYRLVLPPPEGGSEEQSAPRPRVGLL